MFIVGGRHQTKASSGDGATWSDFESGRENYMVRSITITNGKAFAVGRVGPNYFLETSNDGQRWDQTQIQERAYSGGFIKVVYANDQYVLYGGSATNIARCTLKFRTSTDGVNWGKDMDHSVRGGIARNIAFGNGVWCGVGDRGMVATFSDDFSEMSRVENIRPIDTMIDVTFGNGVFVGVGLHGLRRFSEDGVTWSEPEHGEEGEHINSVVWTGSSFVASGAGATFISDNGKNWQRSENSNAPTFFDYHDGNFVGVSYKSRIFHSTNAVDWQQVEQGDVELRCVGGGAL